MKTNLIKAFFVSVLCGMLLSTSAQAQKFFVRLGGGYNIPLTSGNGAVNRTEISKDNQYSYTEEKKFGGKEESVNAGLRLGYMFTANIGADLGIHYHWGITQKETKIIQGDSISYNSISKFYMNQMIFTPALIFSLNQEKKFVPYIRAGIAFSLPSTAYNTWDYNKTSTYPNFGTITDKGFEQREARYRVGFGINAGIGLDVHLGKRFGIYGEIHAVALSLPIYESELTKSVVDDHDILPITTLAGKKFIYKNKIMRDGPIDYSKPQELLSYSISYTLIGLNVGVKMRF